MLEFFHGMLCRYRKQMFLGLLNSIPSPSFPVALFLFRCLADGNWSYVRLAAGRNSSICMACYGQFRLILHNS